MKAIDRFYKYIDYKGVKATNFEKEIGLSSGYLSVQKKRNADIGETVLNKINDYCLDLNIEWLLTGNGEMLKGPKPYSTEVNTDAIFMIAEPEVEHKKAKPNTGNCPFEPVCELKKNQVFFESTNTLSKRLETVEEYQRKYIRLLESYNTMTILFAKAHMKLLHLYYYARQQKDAEKAVDLKVAEKILHDMDEVEEKLQHA
jgi:hypothetical protein